MMKYLSTIFILLACPAVATVDIVGSVEAKCVIQTTKSGLNLQSDFHGNPCWSSNGNLI